MTLPVLVFVQSKIKAEALTYEIEQLKIIKVNCINGDMEQDKIRYCGIISQGYNLDAYLY
ncbi:unnamed protein product (macronuclear) [Paramecium tetraurelia]|uniref:Uncharacterized protein n=1 Tax=Paramecium tetraurelia TaxID=5888 RepID=A0D3B5_PARTE|nr:uncharacterized protein GSPATT00013017001 [Paramecium tetraurelia]CAK77532.1 unnamed protein product [Paramecium tetraurelia]|eukprot:XP_001444929.1 hypothetical protein (macronuclear) [Paramecium tetraurelia strain d4-2]